MAKQVYQYRLGTDNDNFPTEEEREMLLNNLMEDDITVKLPNGTELSGVEQISIETIPGINFYINDVKTRIGITGIYEIDFKEKAINQLRFAPESIDLIIKRAERDRDKKKGRNTKTMLIINVVYNDE